MLWSTRKTSRKRYFFLFLYTIHSVSMWDSVKTGIRRGVGVGMVGKQFVFGFVSLSPVALLPVRKLAWETWRPSGGHANGNQLRNRTQDGFHCLQLYPWKKKTDFCLFLYILFGSWYKWSFLHFKHTKNFLVKSATGCSQSKIACACEITFLTISLLGSHIHQLSQNLNLFFFLHPPSATS